MGNPKGLILDLDGTLVDSEGDLAAALNEVLAGLGVPPLGLEEMKAMVGDGARKLVERALAARGRAREPLEPALTRFLRIYEARPAALSRCYSGVLEVLEQLTADGWRCAVCTNKPATATHIMLRELSLDRFFRAVITGDSLPVKKPDPGPLLAALTALGVPRSRAVAVGDHANDLRAAAAVGVPAIFARYGYGTLSADLPAPLATIDAFTELPDRLARHRLG